MVGLIIFGSRMFGKVDQVKGVFHVATRFFHLNFLPLFPTASYLVLPDGSAVQLEKISWVSVRMAWLRVLLGAVALAALIGGYNMLGGDKPVRTIATVFGAAALCVGAVFFSYNLSRATRERLEALANAGVPSELLAAAREVVGGGGKSER